MCAIFQPCPCPLTNSGNFFARTCHLGPDGDAVCDCNRGYTGRRCEKCSEGFIGNPLAAGGSCVVDRTPDAHCDPRGTLRQHPDGRCECKEHSTGSRCDRCKKQSFFLSPKWSTGCVECFCMGVSQDCTSSTLYRDKIRATFVPHHHDFGLITDYESPQESDFEIATDSKEVSFQGVVGDSSVYFWYLKCGKL